jgi:hypothetical protein
MLRGCTCNQCTRSDYTALDLALYWNANSEDWNAQDVVATLLQLGVRYACLLGDILVLRECLSCITTASKNHALLRSSFLSEL